MGRFYAYKNIQEKRTDKMHVYDREAFKGDSIKAWADIRACKVYASG